MTIRYNPESPHAHLLQRHAEGTCADCDFTVGDNCYHIYAPGIHVKLQSAANKDRLCLVMPHRPDGWASLARLGRQIFPVCLLPYQGDLEATISELAAKREDRPLRDVVKKLHWFQQDLDDHVADVLVKADVLTVDDGWQERVRCALKPCLSEADATSLASVIEQCLQQDYYIQ